MLAMNIIDEQYETERIESLVSSYDLSEFYVRGYAPVMPIEKDEHENLHNRQYHYASHTPGRFVPRTSGRVGYQN